MLRAIGATLIVGVVVIGAAVAATPSHNDTLQTPAPSVEETKLRLEADNLARDRQKREAAISHCMPAHSDYLPPKLFGAMLKECERHADGNATEAPSAGAEVSKQAAASQGIEGEMVAAGADPGRRDEP
ncbi:MAG: hypothetical protein JWP35_4456 [Caulobacter sp.]|nr:hypothetical protein [Caulobacter sp.]